MKKLFIITNLCWISIIGAYSCKEIEKITDSALPSRATLACPGCTDYNANDSLSGSNNVRVYGNTAGLTVATVKKMANNYITNCQQLLSAANVGGGNLDARSAWFSIGTLKEFIFNIEKSACANSCTGLDLGVRIYFAQYPDFTDASFTNPGNGDPALIKRDLLPVATQSPNYSKKHTLFIVPTYTKTLSGGTTVHVDFDPWHIGSDCSNPLAIDTLPANTRLLTLSPDQPQYGTTNSAKRAGPIKGKGFTNNYTNSILLQNHGNLYPPDNVTGMSF
jgi:hypothetical protein